MIELTVNVHTDAKTRITCTALVGPGCNTNSLKIGDVTVFAGPAELRRIGDAIDARIAEILIADAAASDAALDRLSHAALAELEQVSV